jgi:ribosome-binding protein aMBF1 (putative translation factor)
MSAEIIELFPEDQNRGRTKEAEDLLAFMSSLPIHFNVEHCAKARKILGWSVEALSFRSKVSTSAIRDFEAGQRQLREVTLRALAYGLEAEGLIFIRGMEPMKASNARGATSDPRQRDDYHLLE